MATTRDMGAEPAPRLTWYSTTTDQVFPEDVSHVGAPQSPVSFPGQFQDDGSQNGHKKPEPVRKPIDSEVMADPQGARLSEQGHPAFPEQEKKDRHWVRKLVLFSIIAAVIGASLYWGIPEVEWVLSTTSTDDAFVAGHTTNVSPRIEGVVAEVLVERNDRVEPGTVLFRLDREPYEIALAQSEASLVSARSNLDLAKAQVRAQLASARGAFFQRKNLQEALRSRIKSLDAQWATIKSRQASLALARNNVRRAEDLLPSGGISKEEVDQRNNALKVAIEQEKEAWTAIQETRAELGLAPNSNNPLEVPKDLTEQQSSIQNAVSTISSSLAQIGIPFDAHDLKPDEAFEQIVHMDTSEGLENAFGQIIEQAPAVKVAHATVSRAEHDLENARLRLSWTEIKSEIAGYVQDRSANPGTLVEVGQTLVSIRSDYVWVDANFKETQLHHIKIGMPVDLYVDAYPKKVFKGRVSGFLPGTGQSEALLPPENATGNYIKVTQRLPVRIELVEPNPKDTPLFIGLSVVPYVKHDERPVGPDAGMRLHPDDYRQHPDVGGGPVGRQIRSRVEIDSREPGHR
jgi:membrane fusion protein (multidrug efflux system)